MPDTAPFEFRSEICKVSKKLGLVFGYGIITHDEDGPYFDLQKDHSPDDSMLEAVTDFMINSRIADDMHEPDSDHGVVLFSFPLTRDIAKSMGIKAKKHGWIIGMKPGPEQLEKFEDGTYTGFSIGGDYGDVEFVEDD